MTNEEYIRLHREEDVRRLALAKVPEGVDAKWCLQQVEGWQLARRKLPLWAGTEGLWYPPRLSMEQCSSESTARYKRQVAERLVPQAERTAMVDLTGGLGVDFAFMATLFRHATYVEALPHLVELARHNLPLLTGGTAIAVTEASVCGSAPLREVATAQEGEAIRLVYLDPARRDGAGRKTVAIEDCTPNLLDMQDDLLAEGRWVMVKLSPMLDISQALRQLHGVGEVHVVSVQGECKELLFVMHDGATAPVAHCVNLDTADVPFVVPLAPMAERGGVFTGSLEGRFLYEPNASVLKAGVQDRLCEHYPVAKLHPMSHLFVADRLIGDFPGRRFRVTGSSDFGKRNLKHLVGDLRQANLTTRNFPTPVSVLRRQLRLAEGGDAYLFATTAADGRHMLVRCEKAGGE